YECIGCSACVDACDQVMDKVGYPRGLIRYSTEHAMQQNWDRGQILRHLIRPRILLYGAILIVITVAAAWSIAVRLPLKVDVIRDRGVLAREVEGGLVENSYTLRIMNTDEKPHRYRIGVSGLDGIALDGVHETELGPASTQSLVVSARVPLEAGPKGSLPIRFDIDAVEDPTLRLKEKAVFIMP
ncbi:MAG: FixG Ig-like domain-containing protein, partial [Rhodocyclaceae bacterium]|nr:FixG Ig-like domain-containing protein [Rhodocyclaceae bacterium]